MSLANGDGAIGILGFGEVGNTLIRHFLAVSPARLELHVYDPQFDAGVKEGGSRTELHSELDSWIGEVQLVLSVVPGSEAVSAAASAAPNLTEDQLYVDLSTTAPQDTLRARDLVEAAGAQFVDGSILGSVTAEGATARLALSGPEAPRAADMLVVLGLNASSVSSSVGDASMLKALRSVFMKGLEALSVECLVAAHERGLTQEVISALSDLDGRSIEETLSVLVGTHLQHAKRRHEEVQMVRRVLREESQPHEMTTATERVFRRSAALYAGNESGTGRVVALAEALRLLAGTAEQESLDEGWKQEEGDERE